VQFAVHALDATDSTQSEAQRLAAAGAPEGTVVTARHQRAGRGRRGHDWWDAPGQSLLVSVLLRPARPATSAPQLSLLGGLAVAEALATVAAVPARIRWPNDLLVDGRKICGILAEASSDAAGRIHHVILGIGINLAQPAFPAELADRATSVHLVTGHAPEPDIVLTAVLEQVARRYDVWQADGFAALRAAWLERSTLPGQPVRLPDGSDGVGIDVGEDGILRARGRDGRMVHIVSGGTVEEGVAHAARH
jgi:BirA family transcriptional regulator, biotin operon repressor / biotin---[acetyl-CoA-carboxylase] ligase